MVITNCRRGNYLYSGALQQSFVANGSGAGYEGIGVRYVGSRRFLSGKIYHFGIEASRTDASDEHKAKCQAKLDTLLEQRSDLTRAIDTLLSDLASGRKVMKLYRQMKMYNDPSLNPALYGKK